MDRALHDKPGVNAGTRARVLDAARTLGYRPNLAARRLQAGTAIRISVHLPRELAVFWDPVRDGVRQAAALLQPTLQVEFRDHARLGHGDVESFREALDAGVHGLVVAPGDPLALGPWIERAARQKVPVVCVVTDAPGTDRLSSVSADPFTVGAVAGELLGRFVPGGGPVGFFTGWLGTQDHADKLRGFESSLYAGRPSLLGRVHRRSARRRGRRLPAGGQPAQGAPGPEGDLRQHGELAAGARGDQAGGPGGIADRGDDGPVPGPRAVDPARGPSRPPSTSAR